MNKKVLIPIIAGSIALVVGGSVIGFIVTRPMAHYNKGLELYNTQQYTLAAEEFEAAGDYKDAADQKLLALKQQALIDGDQAMVAGDYALACEKYVAAGDLDVEGAKLFEATKNNVYQTGMNHLEAAEYIEAAACFTDERFEYTDKDEQLTKCAVGLLDQEKYADVEALLDGYGKNTVQYKYLSYAQAMSAFNDANYSVAQKEFWNADSIRDTDDMLEKTNYLLGIENFEAGKYTQAYKDFMLVNLDYEDNADYVKKSRFMSGEMLYNLGDYVEAKEIFDEYDDDYECNGVVASERKASINEYSDYFTLIDSWKCCYGNIDARSITGSAWQSWTLTDDTMGDERYKYASVDLTFTVKSDGNVNLKGTVKITFLSEYSYVKSLLDMDEKIFNLNETITSSSGTIELDEYTTLKYSKDSLVIKYEKSEQVTGYTKEVCSSEYKFDHYNFG